MEAAIDRDAAQATALMDAHLRATEESVARILAEAGTG
jgi:DNA-binding GntR family transcriptional regulator